MSECRTYHDTPWIVIVTTANDQPMVLESLVIRCTSPGCGRGFHYLSTEPWKGPVTITKGAMRTCLFSTRVCDCTTKRFELWHGVVPPWLTREEQVAWHLTT